jgi:hypothetical protein
MRKAFPVLAALLVVLLSSAPAAYASPSEAVICSHVVQPGETIYCIARAWIPGRSLRRMAW